MATALGDGIAPVDVGLCRLLGLDGAYCARVFLNVLGFGFDSAVIGRLGRRRLKLGGRLPYLIVTLQEISRARCFRMRGSIDDEPIRIEALILAAGLGRSFGGGIRITPEARPGSGRFQLVWGERLSRLELLCLHPRIYSGRHLNHPKVQSRYARRVELLAEPAALVEAEGELIGKTPIQLEIYPCSLRIACTRIR